MMVSVVSKRLDSSVEIAPRMTTSLRILTGIICTYIGYFKGINRVTQKKQGLRFFSPFNYLVYSIVYSF